MYNYNSHQILLQIQIVIVHNKQYLLYDIIKHNYTPLKQYNVWSLLPQSLIIYKLYFQVFGMNKNIKTVISSKILLMVP